MAKVDFYVLSEEGDLARQRFACRLAEKAFRLDNVVHLLVGDRESANRLDDLMWTFRDGSFVPHEILAGLSSERESPVTIGVDVTDDCDLLINLTDALPDGFASVPRVAEIVTSDPEARQLSRRRFVDYRDQGHTLDTHQL